VLNQAGKLGEISPQAFADILILDMNPAEDISALIYRTSIKMIMMAGRVYKNTL